MLRGQWGRPKQIKNADSVGSLIVLGHRGELAAVPCDCLILRRHFPHAVWHREDFAIRINVLRVVGIALTQKTSVHQLIAVQACGSGLKLVQEGELEVLDVSHIIVFSLSGSVSLGAIKPIRTAIVALDPVHSWIVTIGVQLLRNALVASRNKERICNLGLPRKTNVVEILAYSSLCEQRSNGRKEPLRGISLRCSHSSLLGLCWTCHIVFEH
mmetsp:Transcript_8225/g.17995  ORF Transcript_8225/g.17995 Transcript_8225/m.17995 type:complete len:213 (-) Transcript_8225:329-967(-)